MNSPAPNGQFELPPDLYDQLVDWSRRLERETPFYKHLFEHYRVKSLLDVACGTGQHAAMFNSWGFSVTGADVSPAMIAHCRAKWGESDRLRWIERSFDQPHDPPAGFDAAICVGNSLSIANDLTMVGNVLTALLDSLSPGGVFVVQVLNLWRIPEGPTQWQKHRRIMDEQGDRILLKGIHRVGVRGFVDFAYLNLSEPDLTARFDTTTLLALEAEDLLNLAEQRGATDLRIFGDYRQTPYQREESPDLIIVGCRKSARRQVAH